MDTNKLPRCKNGSRRNKHSKICEKREVIDLVSPEKINKKFKGKRKADAQTQIVDLISPIRPLTKRQLLLSSSTRKNVAAKKIQQFARAHSVSRKKKAATTLQNFFHKAKYSKAQTKKQQQNQLQQRAEHKLKSFFKKNMPAIKHKIRTKFLKSICSDSGVCIAFGKEEDKIKQFFNNFVAFEYAVSRKRIGGVSNNGFVYEITYERDNYLAHAVLKSSSKPDADNLSYEYFVGKIINNHFLKKLPCFVETYGLYQYRFTSKYEMMKNNTLPPIEKLQDILKLYTDSSLKTKRGCSFSQYLCILTQNIKNAASLDDMTKVGVGRTIDDVKTFTENDLAGCLYQVYFALDELRDFFTHYDLHYNNVLLFEPVKTKYIHYNYVTRDGSVCSFKSKYIVKIIDYGRSFILDPNSGVSSITEYNKVCAEPKCKTTCGDDVGYSWLDPSPNAYNINSTRKNNSKDLWLLAILASRPNIYNLLLPPLKKLTKKAVYGATGPAENLSVGYPNHIFNVSDAERCLRELLMEPAEVQRNNASYDALPYTKIGDLNISSGQEMNYVPT